MLINPVIDLFSLLYVIWLREDQINEKLGINLFIHIGKIEFMALLIWSLNSFGRHTQNIIRNRKQLGGFLGSFKGYGCTIIPTTFRQKISRVVDIVTWQP